VLRRIGYRLPAFLAADEGHGRGSSWRGRSGIP
jgi:hypothetical protein